MDVVDIAEAQDSLILSSSIAEVRNKVKEQESLPKIGICLNFGEPCEGRFCDKECRDDYEKYLSALKRNGKLR